MNIVLEFLLFYAQAFLLVLFACSFSLRLKDWKSNHNLINNTSIGGLILCFFIFIFHFYFWQPKPTFQQEPTIPFALRKEVFEVQNKWGNQYEITIKKK